MDIYLYKLSDIEQCKLSGIKDGQIYQLQSCIDSQQIELFNYLFFSFSLFCHVFARILQYLYKMALIEKKNERLYKSIVEIKMWRKKKLLYAFDWMEL